MSEAEIRFRMPEGVDIGARPARTPTAPDLFVRQRGPCAGHCAKKGVAPRAEPRARLAIRARVPIALASTSAAWIPRGPFGEPRDIPRPDVAAPRGAQTSIPALGMFDARSKRHARQILIPTRSRPRPLNRSAQHPAQRQGPHGQGARRRGVAGGQGGQARARRPARGSPHPQRQGDGARQDARRLQSRGGIAGDVSPPGAAQTRAVQGRSGREGEGRRRRGRRLGARVRLRRVVTRVSV